MSALSSAPSHLCEPVASARVPLTRRFSRRIVSVASLTTLALAALSACGGGGGPVAAPDSSSGTQSAVAEPTSATATAAASTTATGGEEGQGVAKPEDSAATSPSDATQATVVATVPASLPEQVVGEVGKVTVIGAPLPKLGRESVEADPARGTKAPILIGTTFSGDEVRIDAAASGRPTIIYFFAHWCPHCNREIPVLNEIRDANGFRPDLDIYGVSTDIRANEANFPPSEWVKTMDWTYPTIIDGVEDGNKGYLAYDSFGAGGFPMAVLINADGTVAARWTGERSAKETVSYIDQYLSY